MTGFSPLASSALGDDGGVINYELTAANIVSQAPSVSSTTLTQDHDLGVVSFVTGSPLLQTTSLTQDHSLTSIALLFGTPVLGGPSITQAHDLTTLGFVTGSPSVPNVTMAEDETFAAPDLETGNPVVNNADLTQDHNLTATGIASGNPALANTAITQEHDLTTTSFVSGTPEANQSDLTQDHSLTPTGFTLGSPTVPDIAASEDETFAAPDLETGNPSVADVDLTQDHDLGTTSFVSGNPSPQTATLTQEHDLSADSFATGSPSLGTTSVLETVSVTAEDVVTGAPSLDTTSLAQDHSLTPNSIVTPVPDVDAAADPDALLAQETQEIEQMIGGWTRRAYEVPDGRLVQGEREIQQTYGDKVSIDRKAKSLIKFGRSAELGTTALETVWTCGDDEVYVTDNTISHLSSSSASDTQEVTIEGHTISDGEFTFVIQTATLNGQNTVALNTDLARVSRIYNSDNTELVGRVVVYENTTLSAGIPTDATKIHIDIPAGFQQSFKAATTFSKNDYFICTGFYGAVSSKQAGSVDFYPEIRQAGKVFRQAGCFTASTNGGAADIILDPPLIVPKNADIRIRCETETNNLVVFGIFKGYIAKVL